MERKTTSKKNVKAYAKPKSYSYTQKPDLVIGELSGLKGQFKPNLIPEIKISYNKGKRILGNVKSSADVQDFIRKQYKRGTIETQEYFNVIYLDRKNSIIGFYRHSKGGVAGTIADLKIVFGIALKSLASSMILSHNHPSNNLKPSQADITLTDKFKEIGKLHDIPVLDHIIVAKQGYYSFADEGLM
jgi:DNA repair protein RadC